MENLAVGKIVPDIEGKDAQNADLKLSNYRGKVALLIFWGGWCHSCHHFLPILRDLRTRLGPDGFTVVGVNSDLPSELTTFLKKEPLHWPNFSDGSSTGPISVVWNIRSWPTLCLNAADGVILAKQPSISNLEETLRPLLKKGS
jgi:peroxiredoxin